MTKYGDTRCPTATMYDSEIPLNNKGNEGSKMKTAKVWKMS